MKRFLLTLCMFLSIGLHSQELKIVRLIAEMDSVYLLNIGYYTRVYRYSDSSDAQIVKIGLNYSSDMGYLMSPASPYYYFSDSVPDGTYLILVNDEAVEKTGFRNGMKNGLSCKYQQDPPNYPLINYRNDTITEFHLLNPEGRVLRFSPCQYEFRFLTEMDFQYYFDLKGTLTGIGYSFYNSSLTMIDRFSEKKLGRPTFFRDYGEREIRRNGIQQGDRLHGQMTVSWEKESYVFQFKKGELTSWIYQASNPTDNRTSETSSGDIEKIRPDLLNFCENR